MKEIPMPLIRLNQCAIVLLITFAIFLNLPVLIYVIAAFQVLGLISNGKLNPVIALAKLAFGPKLQRAEKQAAELNRFNNTIAVILLSLATIFLLLEMKVAAYVAAAVVALAAFVALCGYCIGCTMYYQFKRLFANR